MKDDINKQEQQDEVWLDALLQATREALAEKKAKESPPA